MSQKSLCVAEQVPKEYVDLAFHLADVSGQIIRKYFRKIKRFEVKSDHSPVTIADKEVETALRSVLKEKVPSHNILGEEEGNMDQTTTQGESCYTWVIDPIDGTKAFMTGKPTFGTLIALLEYDKPVLGIIDQPILRERWFGAKGYGCRYNNDLIVRTEQTVEEDSQLEHSVLHATSPDMFCKGKEREAFERLSKRVQYTLYGCDCYAYALLASGFVDLVAEADLKPWDCLSLVPIVENAGGVITDWNGNELRLSSFSGCVLAARNNLLHRQALNVLQGITVNTSSSLNIQSMTGFSRAQSSRPDWLITVDLRSQNARYLDINGRLPVPLEHFESKIHQLLKQFLTRGKIFYCVSISSSEERLPISLKEESVGMIKEMLQRIAICSNLENKLDMSHILQFREYLFRTNGNVMEDEEELWSSLEEVFHQALDRLIQVQRAEGERLVADIKSRVELLRGWLEEIDKYAPLRNNQQRRRIKQRIQDFSDGNLSIDETRLDQELALMADRMDITEETVRFRAHLSFFLESLQGKESQIGQRLNFICQEWLREANTVAAKCADSFISTRAILIKEEVERIREQVQNIL
eukprot:jgi/Galph1/5192/GphlegSOOS_G3854.1